MGYFSNGEEGRWYKAEYCDRCIHGDNHDCVVWFAHLLHNSKDCDNENSILHLLIPISSNGLTNEQCKMFIRK